LTPTRSRLAQVVGWSLGVLLLVVAGCASTRRTVNLSRLTPPYRVEKNEGGRTVAEHTVAPGSPDELAITRWLQSHDSGWGMDLNTYALARRIKGDRFDLNFAGRTCVMNYDPNGKGEWVQVSRTIDESDTLPALFAPDR
jgi:hypothetical protein